MIGGPDLNPFLLLPLSSVYSIPHHNSWTTCSLYSRVYCIIDYDMISPDFYYDLFTTFDIYPITHPLSHSSPQVCLMIQSFGSILSFVCVFKKETSLIFLNIPLKWEENFKAFWTSFLRLCVFLKTLLSLITLFPFCLFLIHQVIGGELQDRLIPIPYSKSTTDQAVREFYNCPVKLLSLYLTLYAWCIPSSKNFYSNPKELLHIHF